jgi:hypothetical protein
MRMLALVLLTALVLGALTMGDGVGERASAGEGHGVVRAEVLEALARDGEADVIVALAVDALREHPRDRALQRAATGAAQARVLGRLAPGEFAPSRVFGAAPALAGTLTASGAARLAHDADVVDVYLDRQSSVHLAGSRVHMGVHHVHGWSFHGDGATVAVLDTGIHGSHSELIDALVGEECFQACPNATNRQSGPGAAADDHGHGTRVSGVIASTNGMAPEADLWAYKVCQPTGACPSSAKIGALDDIYLNRPEVRIVNLSLGSDLFDAACDSHDPVLAALFTALRANNVVLFVATGNDGDKGNINYPACFTDAASVGAVNSSDLVPAFSNSAPGMVDLLAPGVSVSTTNIGGGHTSVTGTSMAAPMASGVAALMLGANPARTADEVEDLLTSLGVLVTDTANGVTAPRIRGDRSFLMSFGEPDSSGNGVPDFLDLGSGLRCIQDHQSDSNDSGYSDSDESTPPGPKPCTGAYPPSPPAVNLALLRDPLAPCPGRNTETLRRHARSDVNLDGVVNIQDVSLVGSQFKTPPHVPPPPWDPYSVFDLNKDGNINIQDISIAAGFFGASVPPC